MRYLYKNKAFTGGSPLSLLEYCKIAKKNNVEVLAVGEVNRPPKQYIESDIEVINFPYFRTDKPIYNISLIIKYARLIKKVKPDLIHTTTVQNCIFHKVIEQIVNVPILYNIPGGNIPWFFSKIMKDKNILVYSEENKRDLVDNGYKSSLVKVITNRMVFKDIKDIKDINDVSDTNDRFNNNNTLKFLLISRLDKDKINSIKYVIRLIDKLYNEFKNIELKVIGGGSYEEELNIIAQEVNEKNDDRIIHILGHKNDVSKYINESEIVFGKGRSVLEGIASKKLSFVVSEESKIFHCSIKNFNTLKYSNFTGRGVKEFTTYMEFVDLLKKRTSNKTFEDSKKLKEETILNYDIRYCENQILDYYEDLILNHEKKYQNDKSSTLVKCFRAVSTYVGIYYYIISDKLRRSSIRSIETDTDKLK